MNITFNGKVNFSWVTETRPGSPAITLGKYGVILNASAWELMGYPSHGILGYDEEKGLIAIRRINMDNPEREYPKGARVFEMKPHKENKSVRLNCRGFARTVLPNHMDQSINQSSIRVEVDYDPDRKLLIAELP